MLLAGRRGSAEVLPQPPARASFCRRGNWFGANCSLAGLMYRRYRQCRTIALFIFEETRPVGMDEGEHAHGA